MSAAKPKPSFSWDAIRAAAGLTFAEVPVNAIRVAEYARRYRITPKSAYTQLQTLERRGALKSARGRREGDTRPMIYYWPVP
jgi:DNA-binding IscR family transcriptional regulator